MKTSK
jgi:hypothetical protein